MGPSDKQMGFSVVLDNYFFVRSEISFLLNAFAEFLLQIKEGEKYL